jgi:hypothetical protein
MPKPLGNPEKTALIALLLVDGEISTPELKKRHGVDLRKDTREALNEAGLITSHTKKSPHRHQITKVGETRCEELLAAMERPPRTSAMLGVVFDVLASVIGYLRQHDIPLVNVIRGIETELTDLESMIRKAYEELSVKPQDWVRLAKLRPRLNGADKDEVDRVLLAMTRTGLVHLAPDSNRKALTADDHAAAIRIGSENKHLVAIEES